MKFLLVVLMCVAGSRAAPAPVDEAAAGDDSVRVDAAPAADTTDTTDPADTTPPLAAYVDPLNSISLQLPLAGRDYPLFPGHSSPYEYVPIHVKLETAPVGPAWGQWGPMWPQWGGLHVLPARK